jgi:hypothetical protein
MSEYNYRYNSDDVTIDLNNDEIYDYVLEREQLKELDNIGPKCMNNFENPLSEHFGNMQKRKKSLATKLFILLIVVITLYLLYSLCLKKNNGLNPGTYKVIFN